MENYKISIILPCYNVEKYLPKCLDSIVNQTYTNLEIICVIDGSLDNSLKICEEYAENDDRIIIINQENCGASASRNSALKIAKGELIMFVDSDDWIDLDTCEKAVESMRVNGSDVVIWSYIREFSDNSKPKNLFEIGSYGFPENETKKIYRRFFGLYKQELSNPENADSIVTIWGKLYKKSILDGIEFVDSKILSTAEDLLFNIVVFSRVNKVSYISEHMYHYRKDNSDSITSNYKYNLYEQWQFLFDSMLEVIKSNDLGNDFVVALNNRIGLSIIGLGLNELDNPNGTVLKIRKIKNIISSDRYKNAYKELTLEYFPIHWKVFFMFAKMNFATGLYILLIAMKKMIGK